MKAVRRIQLRKELKPNYDGWIEPVNLTVPSKKGPSNSIPFLKEAIWLLVFQTSLHSRQ